VGKAVDAAFTSHSMDAGRTSATSADGSWTLDGTFELDILEATGSYLPFVGGHIHMVDIFKYRAGDNTYLEDCFCNIHPKLVAP
jgi:hypothetical protein